MAGVPIKFRCFQCGQLLGASRNKVGGVVACPKCATDLIVPDPDDVATPVSSSSSHIPTSATAGGTQPAPAALDSGVSLDFLDIRPEDIRVEAGVVPVSPPPYTYKPPIPAEPEQVPEPPEEEPTPSRPPDPVPIPPVAAVPEPVAVVADIRTDERTRAVSPRRTAAPLARSRDLVIPRSVVTAWSLFVLMGLGFAFVAGLLAGHFLWGVH